ncbi:MAG: hypothetical protein ACRD5R_11805 [Candidatus Acidiferrales bacterium]
MENIMGLAGLASAIAASIVLALALEWLGLRGLMLLMPSSARQAQTRQTTKL